MKTILVPTDFSENASHATKYAIMLAKNLKAQLILLHAFHISYYIPSSPMPYIIPEDLTEMKKASDKKLEKLCNEIEHERIKCSCVNLEGLAADEIIDYAKKENIDIIVMGTKGASGVKEILLGSIAAKVIAKAECPVIAVPGKATLAPIKKITYATDYDSNDLSVIQGVVELAKKFRAQLNILHVTDGEYTDSGEKALMSAFMSKISDKISYNNLSFEILKGKDVEKKLEQYVKQNATDLMIMSSHHRTLLDRIFSTSITKKMAYHINVPLMAYHITRQPLVLI